MKRGAATILCSAVLVVGLFVVSSPGANFRPPAALVEHVLIVSVDGLKPENYTDPDAHGLKIPTLREIVRAGAWSDGVQPVLPSVTYPSHTTMATGVVPATHGIFTNLQWDPLGQNLGGWRWYAEDIRVPTLWQLAHANGLRTALIHWPVTVGAPADLNVPEYWRANTADDLKLLRALSTPGMTSEVAKEFPLFTSRFKSLESLDEAWTDIACYAIQKLRVNLLMLHVAQVDHWEHEKGPFSAEANAAIEAADGQLARIIAAAKKSGTWETSLLVIVSDHGFAPISQDMRPGVLLRERGLITLDPQNRITDWKASVLTADGTAFLYVHDPNDEATRGALLEVFQPLAGAAQSGIRRVMAHDEIVKMGGDPGAFLALEAADGTKFVSGYSGNLQEASKQKGTHGYFPDRKEMRASLLVYGPSVQPGKIENARLIDIGPTAARWLGLELPKAEGSPLPISLRAQTR